MVRLSYLNTTGEGPQNLCSVFLMLSLSVDSSKYQVLWSEAEGPAVGSVWRHTHTHRRMSAATGGVSRQLLAPGAPSPGEHTWLLVCSRCSGLAER